MFVHFKQSCLGCMAFAQRKCVCVVCAKRRMLFTSQRIRCRIHFAAPHIWQLCVCNFFHDFISLWCRYMLKVSSLLLFCSTFFPLLNSRLRCASVPFLRLLLLFVRAFIGNISQSCYLLGFRWSAAKATARDKRRKRQTTRAHHLYWNEFAISCSDSACDCVK